MVKALLTLSLSLILSAQVALAATEDVKEFTGKALDKAEEIAEEAKEVPGEVAEEIQEAAEEVKEKIKGEKKDRTPATHPAVSPEEWAAKMETRMAAMPAEQKTKVEKLAGDLAGSADAATLKTSIMDLGAEEAKPVEVVAEKLANGLQEGLAGKTLDAKESLRLAQNIDVLVNKEGMTRGEIRTAVGNSRMLLESKGVEADASKKIVMNMNVLSKGAKGMEAASKPAKMKKGATGQESE